MAAVVGGGRLLAQHSSKSSEHYTPPEIADCVRELFGGVIDLDPASCEQANQLVRAKTIYTIKENGRRLPWFGRWYNNPPSERVDGYSGPAAWWAKGAHAYEVGESVEGAYMVFNLETLRHAQAWPVRQPLDFPCCLFTERVRYYHPGPSRAIRSKAPTHPSMLVYLGENRRAFRQLFQPLGLICGK